MRSCLIAVVTALFLSLVCSVALADKVPPPPPDCPQGSKPRTGHGGPYCQPISCKADADCEGETVCKELPMCVGEVSGGGRRPKNVPPPRYPTVLTKCAKADNSACSLPDGAANRYWGVTKGTCQSIKLCLSAGSVDTSATASTAQPTAAPSVAPTATASAVPSDPTAPTHPPPEVDKRRPCSCASSSGGPSPVSLIGLLVLWLAVRRLPRVRVERC